MEQKQCEQPTIQCWSGGKDSTASIILEHELGLPPSQVVFVEVMFDHKRNISGELPEHIDFIQNIAIPKLERWGYAVEILRSPLDYVTLFNKRVGNRSKHPERIGKRVGFFILGLCKGNDNLKMRPLQTYRKQHPGAVEFVGIAADEPKRLERLLKKPNKRSLLAEHGLTEQMCYDLCKKHELLSPLYRIANRGGCWFCPNQRVAQFAFLAKNHPELWEELRIMDQIPDKVSEFFCRKKTFLELDRQVQEYIATHDI